MKNYLFLFVLACGSYTSICNAQDKLQKAECIIAYSFINYVEKGWGPGLIPIEKSYKESIKFIGDGSFNYSSTFDPIDKIPVSITGEWRIDYNGDIELSISNRYRYVFFFTNVS